MESWNNGILGLNKKRIHFLKTPSAYYPIFHPSNIPSFLGVRKPVKSKRFLPSPKSIISRKFQISLDRIIAATNKNLNRMLQEESFLEDLYFRLNVIPLHVPPLHERITDIPLLLEYFLRKTNERLGHGIRGFSPEALAFLIVYQWPGNVRELKNVVEYVCNIRNAGLIELDDLPAYLMGGKKVEKERGLSAVDQVESLLIEEAIRLFGNSTQGKRAAAAYLGVSMATLYRRLSPMSRPMGMGREPVEPQQKPSC